MKPIWYLISALQITMVAQASLCGKLLSQETIDNRINALAKIFVDSNTQNQKVDFVNPELQKLIELDPHNSEKFQAAVKNYSGPQYKREKQENDIKLNLIKKDFEQEYWLGTSQFLHLVEHDEDIKVAAISPDSKYLLTASDDQKNVMTEIQTGNVVRTFKRKNSTSSAAFSPDMSYILTKPFEEETVSVTNFKTGKLAFKAQNYNSADNVQFSSAANLYATQPFNTEIVIKDTQTKKLIRRITEVSPIYHYKLSEDGAWVLGGAQDGNVFLTEISSGKNLLKFNQGGQIHSVLFTADARFVLTATSQVVRLTEIATQKVVKEFKVPEKIYSMNVSPDTNFFAVTMTSKQMVAVVDMASEEIILSKTYGKPVVSVRFSNDSQYLISELFRKSRTHVTELSTGEDIVDFPGVISPDLKYGVEKMGSKAKIFLLRKSLKDSMK